MAISKIKINNVEHELQTTIQNVSGLEAQLNNKVSTNQGTANAGKILKINSSGNVVAEKEAENGTMALRHDAANKTVVFENVSVENLATAGLEHLGITATSQELNYMDGVTDNVQKQFTDAHNRANKFFPDFAMHSTVTDCLNISIVDDWATSSVNRDGVIATEDVSTLVNSPIDSGAFYAYRTVRQVECAGRNPKTIVTLTEAYPMAGRVWIRAYNPDTSSWSDNWVSHTDACTYRDNAKTITDIITNSIVYVCDPTRAVTKPICASEFTTGDGHKLTNKADKNHSHNTLGENFLPNGQNLNTVTTTGVYRLQTAVNAPNDGDYGYGQMFVGHGGGDTIFQMIVSFGTAKVFVRAGNPPDVGGAGSWTAWKTLDPSITTTATGTFTPSASHYNNTIRVRKVGNIVYVDGWLSVPPGRNFFPLSTDPSKDPYYTIGTISEGFRPNGRIAWGRYKKTFSLDNDFTFRQSDDAFINEAGQVMLMAVEYGEDQSKVYVNFSYLT